MLSQEEMISRMLKLNITPTNMAYIIGVPMSTIMKYTTVLPSQLPDAYYIARIQAGKTAKDMAEEINTSLVSVYKVLKARNITALSYINKEDILL